MLDRSMLFYRLKSNKQRAGLICKRVVSERSSSAMTAVNEASTWHTRCPTVSIRYHILTLQRGVKASEHWYGLKAKRVQMRMRYIIKLGMIAPGVSTK